MMESRLLSLALITVTCLAVVVTTWRWRRNSAKNAALAPKPEDVFRFKNTKAYDMVIPFLFRTILCWSFEKDGTKDDTQSYLHFVEQNPPLLKKYKKITWFTDEKIKLGLNNCDSFDATLLNKLLFLVCPEATNNTGLKALLSKTMAIRNSICHGYTGAAVSPTLLDDIKRLIPDLLKLAGSLLTRPQQDIDAKVDKALQMVFDIDKILLTNRESPISDIEKLLATTGVEESKDTWNKRNTHILLPFSKLNVDINDVFIKTNFLEKIAAGNQQSSVSYDELFDNLCSSTNYCRSTVVEGDAGAGKTTLLLKISKRFPRLIIYMQCRDEQIATVSELVQRDLPKTIRDLDMTSVMEALRGTPVLIIIDGYDEVNDTSRALVTKLLNHFSTNYSSKFLISSRPNGSERIRKDLEERGLGYQTLVIKHLSSEEQIDLVGKYAKQMKVEHEEMKETFREKRDICPEMYYPVYIVLFCELFREMQNEVKKMSSGVSLMELFMKNCKGKIEERIKFQDASLHAYEMFCCACDFSLKLLSQSKYIIDKKSQMELSSNLKRVLNTGVSCENVMSCIFSTKTIWNTTQDVSYQFFHTSQHVFMAAQSLLRKCRDTSVVSAESILIQMGLTPGNIEDCDLMKFDGMLNFTIFALLKEDNTEQERLFPLLAQLATGAGIDFPFWADMLGSFPSNERVESEAAKYDEWEITSSSLTAAATQLLSRYQPSLLEVDIPVSVDTPVELRELIEAVAVTSYSGELQLRLRRSNGSVLPCDEELEPLRNARCRLTEFRGCVSSAAAWDGLATVWEKDSNLLSISLLEPLTHQLTRLQAGICVVTVRHCIVDDSALRRPLPDDVLLTVLDVPASGGAAVAGLLTCLAPPEGYDTVDLTRCLLSDVELDELTEQLTGVMRAVEWNERWREAPYSDGRCLLCCSAHDGGRRCIEIMTEWPVT